MVTKRRVRNRKREREKEGERKKKRKNEEERKREQVVPWKSFGRKVLNKKDAMKKGIGND